MARRGVPKGPVNWYLREWMAARGLEGRGAQARMMKLTGWSKATMSQLYNGTQDYSPKILSEASRALNAEDYELLLPPERAMALRRFQADALTIAKHAPSPEPTGTEG
jgi:transcriptional regulator with XRE-family HTH domain